MNKIERTYVQDGVEIREYRAESGFWEISARVAGRIAAIVSRQAGCKVWLLYGGSNVRPVYRGRSRLETIARMVTLARKDST